MKHVHLLGYFRQLTRQYGHRWKLAGDHRHIKFLPQAMFVTCHRCQFRAWLHHPRTVLNLQDQVHGLYLHDCRESRRQKFLADVLWT